MPVGLWGGHGVGGGAGYGSYDSMRSYKRLWGDGGICGVMECILLCKERRALLWR
jgi:hypothetical protein